MKMMQNLVKNEGETFTSYRYKGRFLRASYPRIMTIGCWLGLERAWRRVRKAVEEVDKNGGRGSLERKSQRGER